MNLEKKGIILGAVWGLISFIPIIYCAFSDYCNTNYLPLYLKIISFPVYFGSLIFPEVGLIGIPIAIIIGALIGYGIAKIYSKIKSKKVK